MGLVMTKHILVQEKCVYLGLSDNYMCVFYDFYLEKQTAPYCRYGL